jgi:outer membrane protein assembly factor BamE (lipoprotein component of BamABCDE complex)
MKKKWWIIAAATIAGCIGLAFVIPALRPSKPGVTKENFERIQLGMTKTEVEGIFGGPANSLTLWQDSDMGR